MVFKHNSQPLADDVSNQLACKHSRPLDFHNRLVSFADSSFRDICEKSPAAVGEMVEFSCKSQVELGPGGDVSSGVSVGTNKEFENRAADAPNNNSATALVGSSSFSWVTGSTSGALRSEHSKRPFFNDEAFQVAYKRPKHVDLSGEITYNTCGVPPISVTAEKYVDNGEATAALMDPAEKATGSRSSLFTCSASEEEKFLGPPARVPLFPSYFEEYQRASRFNQVDEMYSPIFDYLPRKPVAIGPNHQAVVPEWRPQGCQNSFTDSENSVASPMTSLRSSSLADHRLIDEDDSDKWIGTCVMPMPDSESLASEVRAVHHRTDCRCLDEGSIRCVRQHVAEAREKIRTMLGQDKFVELGFCDMGEDVAQKWTLEEEQLFQEVVLSNPASLGKNFWEDLPDVFPSRSSKELVSYYFNVFMLRKRAEQNRSDPMNVDSDNDEWQESDDGEFEITEEDEEDSVVESLADQDDITCDRDGHEEIDINEEAEDEECDDYPIFGENEERLYGVSGGCLSKKSDFPTTQLMGKNLPNGVEEQDVQDDSCTSYEDQHNGADFCVGHAQNVEMQHGLIEDHENLRREYRNDGLSSATENDFFVGHCDPKTWDINYTLETNKDEFLSTCNVIEEVFGKGASENDTIGGHGLSQS